MAKLSYNTITGLMRYQDEWISIWSEMTKDLLQHYQTGNCNCDECISSRLSNSFLDKFEREALPKMFGGNVPFMYNKVGVKFFRNKHLEYCSFDNDGIVVYRSIRMAVENKRREVEKPRIYCRMCGSLEHKSNMHMGQFSQEGINFQGYVCSECYTRIFSECECCGKTIMTRGIGLRKWPIMDADGKIKPTILCNNCFSTFHARCNVCQELHIRDNMVYAFEDMSHTPAENLRDQVDPFSRNRSRVLMCKKCIEESVDVCTGCGKETFLPFLTPISNELTLCSNCMMLRQDVMDYNARPDPQFTVYNEQKSPRKDSLFFGVEFELEMTDIEMCINRHDLARIIKKKIGTDYMYCKHDGSLMHLDDERGGGGLEVVTHPFSWKFYKNNFYIFNELFEIIHAHRWWGRSKRCGLHIHMTKGAFTTFHLYKFVRFVYEIRNRMFLHLISQRENPTGDHCHRYCRYWDDDQNDLPSVAKMKRNLVRDKHGAINLINQDTVELRIFRGVDNEQDFKKNMEFVYSLYEFTRDVTVKNLTLERYIQYVLTNTNFNRFRHLILFLYNNITSAELPMTVTRLLRTERIVKKLAKLEVK